MDFVTNYTPFLFEQTALHSVVLICVHMENTHTICCTVAVNRMVVYSSSSLVKPSASCVVLDFCSTRTI